MRILGSLRALKTASFEWSERLKKPRTFSLEETNEDSTIIFSFIEEEKAALPYCHIVSRSGVSASGYYDWLKARISDHTLHDPDVRGVVLTPREDAIAEVEK
jgi:hypothetical protein